VEHLPNNRKPFLHTHLVSNAHHLLVQTGGMARTKFRRLRKLSSNFPKEPSISAEDREKYETVPVVAAKADVGLTARHDWILHRSDKFLKLSF